MLNKRKIGLILIIISFVILLSYILVFNKVKNTNTSSVYNFYDSFTSNSYFGILEIQKIKLNKVIYEIGDINNDVNKNIFLVNDDENFIVLAAHSGSSPISYFNQLNQISINDQIIFISKRKKRVYQIFKKELGLKIGQLKIKRYRYPVLVLITCSKTNNKYQEIYYSRLVLSKNIL